MVMVAEPGAVKSCYSVNHGAGRAMGRKAAIRALDQQQVDASFAARDVLTNCRVYPKDEAPAAYKDFDEVLKSVELAGLARTLEAEETLEGDKLAAALAEARVRDADRQPPGSEGATLVA